MRRRRVSLPPPGEELGFVVGESEHDSFEVAADAGLGHGALHREDAVGLRVPRRRRCRGRSGSLHAEAHPVGQRQRGFGPRRWRATPAARRPQCSGSSRRSIMAVEPRWTASRQAGDHGGRGSRPARTVSGQRRLRSRQRRRRRGARRALPAPRAESETAWRHRRCRDTVGDVGGAIARGSRGSPSWAMRSSGPEQLSFGDARDDGRGHGRHGGLGDGCRGTDALESPRGSCGSGPGAAPPRRPRTVAPGSEAASRSRSRGHGVGPHRARPGANRSTGGHAPHQLVGSHDGR